MDGSVSGVVFAGFGIAWHTQLGFLQHQLFSALSSRDCSTFFIASTLQLHQDAGGHNLGAASHGSPRVRFENWTRSRNRRVSFWLMLTLPKDRKGVFWVVHMFSLVPLNFVIAQFKLFLNRYPKEKIVVVCKGSSFGLIF